MSTFEKMTYIS